MPVSIQEEIEAHARAAYPHECAGFIVERRGQKSVRPIENLAANPAGNVRNDAAWMQAEDEGFEVYLAYHSECDEAQPLSDLDRQWAEAMQTPVLVCSLPQGTFSLYEPPGAQLPYEGRPFLWGALDCAGLFRDFYAREGGIILLDEPHEPDFWKTRDIWHPYLARHGFARVEAREARRGDLILFSVDSSPERPNHCAIWLGRGNDVLIHNQHDFSRALDLYGYRGALAKRLHSFWRHPGFPPPSSSSSPC